MKAYQVKNKIQEIIDNYELSDEIIKILKEIKEEIKDDSTKEEKLSVLIKWMSIFKDVANIYSIFKDFF